MILDKLPAKKVLLSVGTITVLGALLVVGFKLTHPPVSDTDYKSRMDAKTFFAKNGKDADEESLPIINGRLEWLRERYGPPPADFAQRLIREWEKQQRRYPNQVPGAVLTEGSPLWTSIGPRNAVLTQNGVSLNVTDSGRLRTILPHPTDPNIVYILTSGGGIFKTTNFTSARSLWKPITDTLLTTSGGSMSFGRDPGTIYLGLGDPFDYAVGGVVVKTTNGGDSWSSYVTLANAKLVTDIKVDTSGTTDVVLVGTDVGVFRSTDGGATYTAVPQISGAPLSLYAWSLVKTSAGWLVSVADQATGISTLYLSTDRGANWGPVSGSPTGAGRTTLGVGAPGDSVVYAYAATTADAAQLDLFRSADGGLTWTALGITDKAPTNPNNDQPTMDLMAGQAFYNQMILVDPNDDSRNTVYLGGQLSSAKSTNGGQSWTLLSNWLAQYGLPYVHADFHTAAISNATGSPTLLFGSDGGLFVGTNGGTQWDSSKNKSIVSHLIYALSTSGTDSDNITIGLQDNGTRVRLASTGTFNQTIGGDGFGTGWSQANGQYVIGSLYFNIIKYSEVVPNRQRKWESARGINTSDGSFYTPIATPTAVADPSGAVFFTATKRFVYKTTNGGQNWVALFKGQPGTTYFRATAHSVGVHPTNLNRIAVCGPGGTLYITTDGGVNWQAQDNKVSDYAGFNSNVAWANDDTLYVSSENPNGQSFYVVKSTDGGVTWEAASNGLPLVPVSKVLVSQKDPSGETLYAATAIGVYESTDGGSNWHLFGAGLPAARVSDLYMPADGSFMRVATYGRGLWQITLP
ncbi:MAG: hypothetical protein H7Y22_17940 [Gemmatimonadaceae bacterium]|nr:hypothetical protein [Gloeobacterales cyanobacterium ES-bin-141]